MDEKTIKKVQRTATKMVDEYIEAHRGEITPMMFPFVNINTLEIRLFGCEQVFAGAPNPIDTNVWYYVKLEED